MGESDDRQAIRAREILWNLLYNQSKDVNAATREVWAENATMLHEVYQNNPEALSGSTRAVLWCLSQFLEQYPGKLTKDVSWWAGNGAIEGPGAGDMAWAKDLIEYDRYKPHATVDLLIMTLKKAALGAIADQKRQTHATATWTPPKM